MPETTSTVLDYARRGVGVARRGGRGFGAFIAAILLSPLVVLSIMQFLNGLYHEEVETYGLPVIIILMIASVVVPVLAIATAPDQPARLWALAGLAISVVGWGVIILFLMVFVPPWAGVR